MEEQIKKIIKRALERNNWGLYFKGQPLMEMPVNGESSIYKLNEVEISEREGAISEEVDIIINEINNQGDTECQDETMNRSSDVS